MHPLAPLCSDSHVSARALGHGFWFLVFGISKWKWEEVWIGPAITAFHRNTQFGAG